MNKALVELPKTKDKCKNPCCQPKVTYTLAPFFHGAPIMTWKLSHRAQKRDKLFNILFCFS
jgi:hypothetical protein